MTNDRSASDASSSLLGPFAGPSPMLERLRSGEPSPQLETRTEAGSRLERRASARPARPAPRFVERVRDEVRHEAAR